MKTGRPPSWNPVAALAPGVWTDVVQVTSKDRIGLPVRIRQSLAWLKAPERDVLGVVEADGSVELLPWAQHGDAALDDVRRALKAAKPAIRDLVALAAMDRYVRLSLDAESRLVLPSPLIAHLGGEGTAMVRVVMRDGRLWLWSEPRWLSERADRIAALTELAGQRPD